MPRTMVLPNSDTHLPLIRTNSHSPLALGPRSVTSSKSLQRVQKWQQMGKRKSSKNLQAVMPKSDWRNKSKLDPRKRTAGNRLDSETENPEEGGIYPASSEPEWALKESKLKGIFKKTKPNLLLKNHHKAPINRVIETTEDEDYDGYGRT